MSTQHEYERYRNDLTGEGRDPQHYLRWGLLVIVFVLAVLYPIFCTGQMR